MQKEAQPGIKQALLKQEELHPEELKELRIKLTQALELLPQTLKEGRLIAEIGRAAQVREEMERMAHQDQEVAVAEIVVAIADHLAEVAVVAMEDQAAPVAEVVREQEAHQAAQVLAENLLAVHGHQVHQVEGKPHEKKLFTSTFTHKRSLCCWPK